MKGTKFYIIALCILFCMPCFAQLEVDHPIELTGSGTNAKVTGIQSVTGSRDATSVEAVQKGSFIYATATGSGNNFNVNITPALSAYQSGMVFNFVSNQTVTGASTLNVNNLGPSAIKKSVNMDLTGCEIENGQVVTVVYDGTNFQMTSVTSLLGSAPSGANAGPDQLNVSGYATITLAANTPSNGTGVWSILSGQGGNITNTSNPTSTFTGQPSTTYILQWTVSNSCGTSSDSVTISFSASCYQPGNQTFGYTGSQQIFTVPCDVTSVTIECWGAQGGGGSNTGGHGGYAKGDLAVTTGQTLYVYVGQAGSGSGSGETFGGGGNGGYSDRGSGGGASDVRSGGNAIANRVIVAGGGGGTNTGGTGGAGGGNTGGNGSDGNSFGGTQNTYGTGSCCPCNAPTQGNGQDGYCGGCNGAGGGGGYYGGGACTQGGGGSGYVSGVTNSSMQNGLQTGNGQIKFTW